MPTQIYGTPGQQQAVVGELALIDQTGTGSVTSPVETVRKSNTGMRLGLAGALLAVTGLGGFAVKTALSEPAGPETPEEAMEAFFEAFAEEDLVGMAETLLPSEREAFIDPTLALTDEIERLEVFGAGVEIDTLGTIDIVVEELVVVSSPMAPGFAVVESAGGTLRVIGGPDDIPALVAVSDWIGEVPEPDTEEVTDLAANPLEMVAVQEDGVWYLSLGYTLAETVRVWSDSPMPVFGAGPTPVGGSTPEAALENFLNETVNLNLEGMLTQIDPEEMRVLYDYSPLFLPDAQEMINEGLSEAKAEGVQWGITSLDLRSDDSRGRTIVFLDGIALEASMGEDHASLVLANDCVTVKTSGEMFGNMDETMCEGDTPEGLEDSPWAGLDLDDIELPDLGITVVQRGGNWYISSVPSAIYSWIDVLGALEPADVQALKDSGQELFEMMMSGGIDPYASGLFGNSAETKFTEVGERIDSDYEDYDDSDYDDSDYDDSDYDESDYNFVDIDPSYVPDGLEAYSEDTNSWWLSLNNDLAEPVGLFSIWGDEEWVTIAEYPTQEEAMAAMAQLVATGFEGDVDLATDSFTTVSRSGRFLLSRWDEGESLLVDQMAEHLAER